MAITISINEINTPDVLFEIPILLYNQEDVKKRARITDENEYHTWDPIPYAIGKCKIYSSDIIGYHEYWERGRSIEDVVNEGLFNTTCIMTKSFGELVINWDIKKFEKKLKEHENRFNEMSNKIINQQMNKQNLLENKQQL